MGQDVFMTSKIEEVAEGQVATQTPRKRAEVARPGTDGSQCLLRFMLGLPAVHVTWFLTQNG